MVVPCLIILVTAFYERGIYGGVDWRSSPSTISSAPANGSISRSSSIRPASPALPPLFALLIGYPAAYAIAKAAPERQTALLFLAMLPFWTNYLIRTYAWIVLLNPAGLINNFLQWIGLIQPPLPSSTMSSR